MCSFVHWKIHVIIFLAGCFFPPLELTAQTKVGRFIFFGQEDIPSNTNRKIYEDSRGYLWLCSQNGLFKYDGYTFAPYYSFFDDPNSLSSNNTTDVEEDDVGNLWIATIDHGVSKMNPFTGAIWQYPKLTQDNNDSYTVNDIFRDHSGIIWFATGGRGLARYLPDQDSFINYIPDPDRIQDGSVRFQNELWEIAQDPIDLEILWVVGLEGLYRFDQQSETFEKFEYITAGTKEWSHNAFHCIFIRDLENIWLGTWGAGLVKFNYLTGKFDHFLFDTDEYERKDGTSNIILDILPVADTALYICSFDRGLFTFSEKKLVFRPEFSDNIYPLLSDHTVSCRAISKTRNGSIWVSGENYLLHSNPLYERFKLFLDLQMFQQPGSAVPLFADVIYDEQSHKYYAAIYRINSVLELNEDFSVSREIPILYAGKNAENWNIIKQNDRFFLSQSTYPYLSYWQSDLCCFRPVEGNLLPRGTLSEKLQLSHMLQTSDQTLWSLGQNKNLIRWNPQSGSFKTYDIQIDSFADFTRPLLVDEMKMDSRENLWFSSSLGLIHFDTGTEEFKLYSKTSHGKNPFATLSLGALTIDQEDKIWVTSRFHGIQVFDPQNAQITNHYTLGRGNYSNHFDCLTVDQDNNIWGTSNNGLVYFDRQREEWKIYTVTEGLAKNYLTGVVKSTSNNKIFLGAGTTLYMFDAAHLPDNPNPPSMHITGFNVLGKPYQMDTLPNFKKDIELKPQENQITISFAGVETLYPDKVKHSYRMLGIDTVWRPIATREVTFADLKAGYYTFEVHAENSDGVKSVKPARISFEIKKKIIQTVWFKLGSGLALFGLLYLLYLYRLGQITKLQNLKNRISADLHDDIGSRLTSIQLLTAILGQKRHIEAESPGYLGQIEKEINHSSRALDEIVWNMKSGFLDTEQVVARMRHFAAELFESSQVNYRFEAGEGFEKLKINPEKLKDLYLIYREILNNISKHAHAGGVEIQLSHSSGIIRLKVEDDGVGFESSEPTRGNGIRNMQMRLQRWKGLLDIDSSIGEGTQIMVTLPSTSRSPLKGMLSFRKLE